MATRNDDAVTSLADGRLLEELECAICYEIMTQPTSLTCNHSFCSDCVSGLPNQSNTIRCPVCRKQQRRLDELPQNKQLMVVCNLARHAQEITCQEHAGSALEFYCADCDRQICAKCAIVGEHRGHAVEELKAVSATTKSMLQDYSKKVDERKKYAMLESQRVSAAFDGLISRVDDEADAAIRDIERNRAVAIKELRAKCLTAQAKALLQAAPPAQNDFKDQIAQHLTQLPHADGQLALRRDMSVTMQELVPEEPPRWQGDDALAYMSSLPSFSVLQAIRTAAAGASAGAGACAGFQVFLAKPISKCLQVEPQWTGEDLGKRISSATGIPAAHFGMIYRGRFVDLETPIGEQGLQKGCTLEVRPRAPESWCPPTRRTPHTRSDGSSSRW